MNKAKKPKIHRKTKVKKDGQRNPPMTSKTLKYKGGNHG